MERLAYKWKVLISVIFGLFMVILDTTAVNVAFPTLRREFAASLSESQWVISLYVMSLGVSTPLAGFLADRFGIKRIYVGGLAAFVLGSLLCALAPNLWLLILARALQGVGGGVAVPLGTAQLYGAFPPKEQGLALGLFGIALVVAPATGPILGGWLVDLERWRWIFLINLPIGLTGITLASHFLREQEQTRKVSLDPWGLLTSTIGFSSALYAASIAADRGWSSPWVLCWFATGACALAAFALIELRVAKEPLLDLRLFGRRTFTLANLIGYGTVLALFGAEFLLPVYLQTLRGKTALESGFIVLPLAVTAGVFTPLAGRLYDRIGPRLLVVIGFSVLLINTWQLSQLTADTSMGWIMFLMALRGTALGMTVQTTFVTGLSVVPMKLLARGSSLISATRYVVQSIGVALLATVLASSLSPEVRLFQRRLRESPAAHATYRVGLCGRGAGAPQPGTFGAPELLSRACSESLVGFKHAYHLTFLVSLAAVALGALLPGWPRQWRGRGAASAADTVTADAGSV